MDSILHDLEEEISDIILILFASYPTFISVLSHIRNGIVVDP